MRHSVPVLCLSLQETMYRECSQEAGVPLIVKHRGEEVWFRAGEHLALSIGNSKVSATVDLCMEGTLGPDPEKNDYDDVVAFVCEPALRNARRVDVLVAKSKTGVKDAPRLPARVVVRKGDGQTMQMKLVGYVRRAPSTWFYFLTPVSARRTPEAA